MTTDPGSCPFTTTATCGPDPYGDGWFTCNVGGVPQGPGCAPGEKPNFYVWYLDQYCGAHDQAFCAADQDAATQWANSMYAETPHGPAGPDPTAPGMQPTPYYECATGDNCTLGSSDDGLGTMFYGFTHDDILACEQLTDHNCTWTDSPMNNDSCPMQM
jgi:hypothetical protein